MIPISTRSQILFVGDRDDNQLLTYKHSDGYPSGVIPLLRRYYHWMPRTNDFEYFTATWFYYVKRRYEKHFLEDGTGYAADTQALPMETDELGHNHGAALNYGVCADNTIHGDIEHLYVVHLSTETIHHYGGIRNWNNVYDTPRDIIEHTDADTIYALDDNPHAEFEGEA